MLAAVNVIAMTLTYQLGKENLHSFSKHKSCDFYKVCALALGSTVDVGDMLSHAGLAAWLSALDGTLVGLLWSPNGRSY